MLGALPTALPIPNHPEVAAVPGLSWVLAMEQGERLVLIRV